MLPLRPWDVLRNARWGAGIQANAVMIFHLNAAGVRVARLVVIVVLLAGISSPAFAADPPQDGQGSHAPPQPPDSAWQADIILAQRVCSRLDAPVRRCRANGGLNRTEQPRQPDAEKIREETEGAASLWAVPARHADALRACPFVGAVAAK